MTGPQPTVSLPRELVEQLAEQLATPVADIVAERQHADEDRWLDKQQLAAHLGCGVRWVEERLREGMPSAMLAGRRKFQRAEVERWLEAAGHLQRGRYRRRVPADRARAATMTATAAREETMPRPKPPQTARRAR